MPSNPRDVNEITVDIPLADAFPILKMSPEERTALMINVLDRGQFNTRLNVQLPPDFHGEWVRNDPTSISRMQGLGYQIDRWFAGKQALHTDGSGNPIVGDVIFMICPRAIYEELEKAKRIRYWRDNNPSNAKEDQELNAMMDSYPQEYVTKLPTTNKMNVVSGQNIDAALSGS